MSHREILSAVSVAIVMIFLDYGCASVDTPATPPNEVDRQRERNSGYSLLYELVSKESDVNKVLFLKHAEKDIGALVREIAETSRLIKQRLEAYAHDDSSLHLKETELPTLEQKTRDAIDAAMTKQLLLSNHEAYETRLLMSQAESMRYAAYLAEVTEKDEPDQTRKEYLKYVSRECLQLYEKTLAHLAAKP